MHPVMSCSMRCCFSEPVDFDSEVDLFHFDLHKAVGKGALGQGSRTQAFSKALRPQMHR
ncbi:hypothetical protein EDD22DRAFT_873893 [Suillus occidentalis]|nr:hypothetical protein EDD22DRAFT_873893 [Suillus occidentalis]